MIPASIRNNNPGAMYPGKVATQFGSTHYNVLNSHDGTHKIACFDDPVDGAAAQFSLLSSPSYTGRTIREAITKWCGGYYASTYLKVLSEKGGVTADTLLTKEMLSNPQIAIPLAKAMAWQEAGCDFPMSDEQWASAHAKVFGNVVVAAVPKTAAPDPQSFKPDNPLPSPKPETRVAEMKSTSRKWSLTSFLQWLVGLPTAFQAAHQSGVANLVSLPNVDFGSIQGQLNATKSILASLNDLGPIGLGVMVLIGIQVLRQFMVEDSSDGRAVPSGSKANVAAG